jgi:hypothetical protein
MVMAAT